MGDDEKNEPAAEDERRGGDDAKVELPLAGLDERDADPKDELCFAREGRDVGAFAGPKSEWRLAGGGARACAGPCCCAARSRVDSCEYARRAMRDVVGDDARPGVSRWRDAGASGGELEPRDGKAASCRCQYAEGGRGESAAHLKRSVHRFPATLLALLRDGLFRLDALFAPLFADGELFIVPRVAPAQTLGIVDNSKAMLGALREPLNTSPDLRDDVQRTI